MTSTTTEGVGRVESRFLALALLWTGLGLLASLAVAALVARNDPAYGLVWGGSRLIPLGVVVAQLGIISLLGLTMKRISFSCFQ